MIEVRTTTLFADWFRGLRDERARARIQMRINRVELGLIGDVKYFDGIGEMRIDYGPGYRLYFTRQGETIVILLCGGDKGSQKRDIKRAVEMAGDI